MRIGGAGLGAVMALCAALAGCGPRAEEARLLLEDMAVGSAPSAFKAERPEPQRAALDWIADRRPGRGYLYAPGAGEPAARIILVPGLVSDGIDDDRLQAFARTLARARFLVLTPDITGFRSLEISPDDSRAIADAALTLAGHDRPPGAPPRRVGLAAISYAVGPTLLAARDPRVQAHASFVLAIGGYHSMARTITYVTTGAFRASPGAPWQFGAPNPFGAWVFARVNARRVVDPADRTAIAAMAARRLADPAAPLDDLTARLGPEGRAVYALIANRDPERVPALIADLPAPLREDIAALDLSAQDMSGLGAEVILVHGRDDPLIPSTESAALAAALPRARLVIVDHLAHVEFDGRASLLDQLRLLGAGMRLLALRDADAHAGSL